MFFFQTDLDRHVASVNEGKKPFKCEKCHNNFALKSKLEFLLYPDMNHGKVYTGKKGSLIVILKITLGRIGLLFLFEQRYLHQNFFTTYLGHF